MGHAQEVCVPVGFRWRALLLGQLEAWLGPLDLPLQVPHLLTRIGLKRVQLLRSLVRLVELEEAHALEVERVREQSSESSALLSARLAEMESAHAAELERLRAEQEEAAQEKLVPRYRGQASQGLEQSGRPVALQRCT